MALSRRTTARLGLLWAAGALVVGAGAVGIVLGLAWLLSLVAYLR